jgi:predicted GIY-YIG superfamily endonuclease
MHGIEKRIVYILRSDADPFRHYIGITNDLRGRLDWHNHGPCGYTTNHRPWSVVVSMEFPSEHEARRFEKYLKSGSGRAFTKRHFGPLANESLVASAEQDHRHDDEA